MDISSKIQNVIEEQLKEIEEKENVKIIYCVESGSRAWEFASPDSDYDVRFIYVRNKEDYLKADEMKLKKYFYVIRPILTRKWILDKKTAPPMLFSELMNECLDDELTPEINRLLEIKKQTSELGKGKRIDVINDYIEKELEEIEKKADIIENEYNDWEILNKIFLEILEQ